WSKRRSCRTVAARTAQVRARGMDGMASDENYPRDMVGYGRTPPFGDWPNNAPVAAMNEAGWEIATHGLKWIDYRDTPAEVEARHIAEAVRIHAEVAGARPLGFYQGRSSLNTIRLGMEEGGFLYCADSYADDLPYWLNGPRGPQLMIPYT